MIGTIIVSLVLVFLIVCAVLVLVKNKKSGKSSCAGGCFGCPMAGNCQKEQKE